MILTIISCKNENRNKSLKPEIELSKKKNTTSEFYKDNSEVKYVKDETNQTSYSQILKDLDKDGIKDSISFGQQKEVIICKLSTNKFKPIYSQTGLSDEMSSGIKETKNGFEFYVNHMRAGFANQFRYEEKDKKIRLIGMSRYEFGPANNDGSGNSSVNLLTNKYIGEWHHYDLKKEKLIKMPTIKSRMYFSKIYLENYNSKSQYEYQEKCSALYYIQKKKM